MYVLEPVNPLILRLRDEIGHLDRERAELGHFRGPEFGGEGHGAAAPVPMLKFVGSHLLLKLPRSLCALYRAITDAISVMLG